MSMEKIKKMEFRALYPSYVNKAVRKNRTKEEVENIICWFTGIDPLELESLLETDLTVEELMQKAKFPETAHLITGVVCGVRVETIEEPFTKHVRQLDKLVDELAKGKKLEKIIR